MSSMDLILLWSDRMVISISVWATLSIILLYLARKPAHQAIQSVCHLIKSWFSFCRQGNTTNRKDIGTT